MLSLGPYISELTANTLMNALAGLSLCCLHAEDRISLSQCVCVWGGHSGSQHIAYSTRTGKGVKIYEPVNQFYQ